MRSVDIVALYRLQSVPSWEKNTIQYCSHCFRDSISNHFLLFLILFSNKTLQFEHELCLCVTFAGENPAKSVD